MNVEEYFKQKFGNELRSQESWVIRFAEEYTEIKHQEDLKNRIFFAEYIQQIILQMGAQTYPALKDAIEVFDATLIQRTKQLEK